MSYDSSNTVQRMGVSMFTTFQAYFDVCLEVPKNCTKSLKYVAYNEWLNGRKVERSMKFGDFYRYYLFIYLFFCTLVH